MFKKGQLVTLKPGSNRYSITSQRSLCIIDLIMGSRMNVTIVAHANGDNFNGEVDCAEFVHCTYEAFMNKYPNAVLTSHYTAEQLSKINNGEEAKEEIKMETAMDKEKIGSYALTDEERESLRTEIKELLIKYDYNPTDYGVNAILDEWIKNKGWMINLFKQHPNYNGKFQIVFDSDYQRVCDKEILYRFKKYFLGTAKEMFLKEKQIGAFSYREVSAYREKLEEIVYSLCRLRDHFGYYAADYEEKKAELYRWSQKYDEYQNAFRTGTIIRNGSCTYDAEAYSLYDQACDFADEIYSMREHIADDEFARKVNRYFPSVKAVSGQKTSRIIGKICKALGIDKHPEYNREFAKYADAINPLVIKRHTVLSCHPVDYLTMSFGNSWASCHTIDKTNKREMPNDYEGCYSSGTLSYMLDGSSFVYYTVDKDYNGNELELQDKINRNMFHMGEDKLVQARVYPQATDGEEGIYKQIREIAQKVIADCLNVPNLWKNVKGTNECGNVIYSYGTHYRDYTNFSDCNVSYLKGDTEEVNRKTINVGHLPICPSCGNTHDYQKAIECSMCYTGEQECWECGDSHDTENMHLIDGHWYCEDCCFYCEYHEEWETCERIYVSDYEYVCEDALETDDFYRCDRCGHVGLTDEDDHIETENGNHYCNYNCAERDGYRCTDNDEWYPEDEVCYCEHCERDVHVSEWNGEFDCCNDCIDEVSAEREAV